MLRVVPQSPLGAHGPHLRSTGVEETCTLPFLRPPPIRARPGHFMNKHEHLMNKHELPAERRPFPGTSGLQSGTADR